MAFVRLLKDLIRSKDFGHRVVPIIPDEARTFGMDAFFPNDEDLQPQRPALHLGRPRAAPGLQGEPAGPDHPRRHQRGRRARLVHRTVGTSYSTQGEPLIPVYVFYSMFGFQRTGDAMWAAGDQMARGFVIGATAGRTTLTGEGLQHADGHSLLLGATNPAVVAYDPAYGYEIGHIVRAGLERMYGGEHPDPNVMYYLTVYNEPYVQPAEPEGLDVDGVVRGIYKLKPTEPIDGPKAQLLASGVAVPWALEAQKLLAERLGRLGRRLVGHVLVGAAPRRPRGRGAQLPVPGCRAAVAVRLAEAGRSPGPVRRRDGLLARGPRPDPPVRARAVRDARRRRLRLLGHPRGRPSLLQDRRPVGGGARSASCSPRAARSTAASRPRRSRSTSCTT